MERAAASEGVPLPQEGPKGHLDSSWQSILESRLGSLSPKRGTSPDDPAASGARVPTAAGLGVPACNGRGVNLYPPGTLAVSADFVACEACKELTEVQTIVTAMLSSLEHVTSPLRQAPAKASPAGSGASDGGLMCSQGGLALASPSRGSTLGDTLQHALHGTPLATPTAAGESRRLSELRRLWQHVCALADQTVRDESNRSRSRHSSPLPLSPAEASMHGLRTPPSAGDDAHAEESDGGYEAEMLRRIELEREDLRLERQEVDNLRSEAQQLMHDAQLSAQERLSMKEEQAVYKGLCRVPLARWDCVFVCVRECVCEGECERVMLCM